MAYSYVFHPRAGGAHHPFSPSQLERLAACPGSYTLSQGIEDIPSDEAAEGTKLHRALSAPEFLDDLDTTQTEMVQKCKRFLAALKETHPEVTSWVHERPLKLVDAFEVISEGTADLVGIAPSYVVVVDWKFGHKEVATALLNVQLRTYAAMAMQELHIPQAYTYIFHARAGGSTHARMQMEEYNATLNLVRLIRTEALDSQRLRLFPSEASCQYCPARTTCPALVRLGKEVVAVHSSAVTSPEEMSQLLHLAKMVKTWANSVEYHAKEMAMKMGRLPGWKLRPRKGARSITDTQAAYDILSAYLSPAEFIPYCSVDVGPLEEAFIRKRKAEKDMTLAAARAEFESLLLPVLTRGKDSQTLVSVGL